MQKQDETSPQDIDRLDAATMQGYWYKEYADLGHWFNKAMTKCVNCGAQTIDLFEDGSYGYTRKCVDGGA